MKHSRRRWKEIARGPGGGRGCSVGPDIDVFFTNFFSLSEDFWQSCAVEFTSFQGYWLPEGILVLKMKNDSLNTIVQFRGITYLAQLYRLWGNIGNKYETTSILWKTLLQFQFFTSNLMLVWFTYSKGRPGSLLVLAPASTDGFAVSPPAGNTHSHEGARVPGWQDSRMAAWKSFFWVTALCDFRYSNMSGN